MSARVLVALGRHDMAELGDILLDALESRIGAISPDSYRSINNLVDALGIIVNGGMEFDPVLTHMDLPRRRGEPMNLGAALGLDLVEKLRDKSKEVPCVVLAPSVGGSLIKTVQDIPDCYIVQLGVGWRERFLEALERIFPGTPEHTIQRGEPIAEVEIRFSPASYRIHTRNTTLPIDVSGSLEFDTRIIKQLVLRTAEVSTFAYPHWRRNLEEIGRMLFEVLAQSGGFRDNFEAALKSVNKLENIRFRFAVDADIYRIALEALHHDFMSSAITQDVFWMLKTPMVRLLRRPTVLGAAARPKGFSSVPINVLIIGAGVSGFVEGAGYLPPLANVKPECQLLASLIEEERHKGPGLFAEPTRISVNDTPDGISFIDYIKQILMSGTIWHLVHFGGHCFFSNDDNEGCIFLPDSESIASITLSEFAGCLSNVCLLYLTSCRYSEDDVVLHLLQSPTSASAIVGFRWDLDDGDSVHYAGEFYKEFVNSGLVEDAFVRARNALYSRHETNRIWVSPVLVLRDSECVDVAAGADARPIGLLPIVE